MAKQRDRTPSIHYVDREGRQTLPVSGAYGGLGGHNGGSVIIHVYHDWGMVPSIEQVNILESGQVGEPKYIKRGDVNREVQATLIMAPEAAISIGRWLVEKGVTAYRMRQQQEPPVTIEEEGDNGE